MDTLIDYQGFEDDIRNSFKDVISNFKFELIKISEGNYEMNNGQCRIIFTYDRGDVFCFLSNPQESNNLKKYTLWGVYRFLYPNDKPDNKWYKAEIKLKNLANIAISKLGNVLLGDFSWVPDFVNEQNLLRNMIRYATNKLDRKNPIYRKFIEDDPSWILELKNYIIENNIHL
jgi:hypothetical protein